MGRCSKFQARRPAFYTSIEVLEEMEIKTILLSGEKQG